MNTEPVIKQFPLYDELELAGADRVRRKLLAELEDLDDAEKVEVVIREYAGYSAAFLKHVIGGAIRDGWEKNRMDKNYFEKHLVLAAEPRAIREYVSLAHNYMNDELAAIG